MSTSLDSIKVVGVAGATPAQVRTIEDDVEVFGDEARKIQQNTGVESRPVAPAGLCSSDLCQAAAEALLPRIDWPRDSIDAVILVTQTPDFILPASACVLQHRLGHGDPLRRLGGVRPAGGGFDV